MFQQKNRTPRARQGFTLIELMVALTGALFFSIFVFMLSRDVTRFFQGQARIADTTLATITGFERLRNDIARAGYLASPNLARDIARCPRPTPGGPAQDPQQIPGEMANARGLQEMAMARIIEGQTLTDNATNYMYQPAANNGVGGLSPDQLILYGNYTTAEQFPVSQAIWGSIGATTTLLLEPDSSAMLRIGMMGLAAPEATTLLQTIFVRGKILRLVDGTGREQYTIIDQVQAVGSPPIPQITTQTLSLVMKADQANGALCGFRGIGADIRVNPVDIIRYELVSLGDANNTDYGQFTYLLEGEGPSYDSTRMDFLRFNLLPTLDPARRAQDLTDGERTSAELVAEYAVDLNFGVTVMSNVVTGQLEYYGETDSRVVQYAGHPVDSAAGLVNRGPHLIRGIHARLALRSRSAEQSIAIQSSPETTPADLLFRVKLSAKDEFSRLRMLRSHIATRNSRNVTWN